MDEKRKEFIKWLVSYAKGFELSTKTIEIRRKVSIPIVYYNKYYSDIEAVSVWELYPLLLQRAIEGINKTSGWLIRLKDPMYIQLLDKNNIMERIPIEFNIDEAKEQALKYIWEQEK